MDTSLHLYVHICNFSVYLFMYNVMYIPRVHLCVWMPLLCAYSVHTSLCISVPLCIHVHVYVYMLGSWISVPHISAVDPEGFVWGFGDRANGLNLVPVSDCLAAHLFIKSKYQECAVMITGLKSTMHTMRLRYYTCRPGWLSGSPIRHPS